jgi:ribose transport system permease protein
LTASSALQRAARSGPNAVRDRNGLTLQHGRLLGAAGFLPVWGVLAVLCAVAAFIAPNTLSSTAFSEIRPFMTFLAIASLGQMLVIMTGGIDLSVPSVISMVGTVMLGVSGGEDGGLAAAVVVCLAWAAVIGLVNGLLVGYLGLNPLIATLAVGQIVLGATASYRTGIAHESAVPPVLASWAGQRVLGATWIFWCGVALTLVVATVLARTTMGRRLQVVGANREAAWIAGVNVRRFTAAAYVAAALLYAAAGILLAAFLRSPTLEVGAPYLLGPIAAVVIAGASLRGGLASALSTWAAAFALTFLATMLRVMGLPSALQFVVFGGAIAAGMVISGDRIVGLAGHLTLRSAPASGTPPSRRDRTADSSRAHPETPA